MIFREGVRKARHGNYPATGGYDFLSYTHIDVHGTLKVLLGPSMVIFAQTGCERYRYDSG